MLHTGFRTFHFVSFLYVFFFSFLFLLFRFFFAFRFFFSFLFVTFLLVFFPFFFFPFLFVSFRFFRFSVYRYPQLHVYLYVEDVEYLLRVKFNKIRSVVAETPKIFSQSEARTTIFVDESARNLHTNIVCKPECYTI